jgi:hypothetical protein
MQPKVVVCVKFKKGCRPKPLRQEHPILSGVESVPLVGLPLPPDQPPELREARGRSGFLLQRTTAPLTKNILFGIDSLRHFWKGVISRRRSKMPGDPKECRQHALNCVRLAQTGTTPQSRDQFASLARTWIKLADDLERCQAFLAELEDETKTERRTG